MNYSSSNSSLTLFSVPFSWILSKSIFQPQEGHENSFLKRCGNFLPTISLEPQTGQSAILINRYIHLNNFTKGEVKTI